MDNKMLQVIAKGRVLALIPARGNSRGVPRKNVRAFHGHPLIAWSIAAAKLSRQIDRVIVSTDSEEIADIAKEYRVEVPFLRPAEYARDDSPDIEFVEHAIVWLYENERQVPEYIVHLRPTSPVREWSVVDEAIKEIQSDADATSLRSGHICAHAPYKWFRQGATGYLEPLFGDRTNDEVNMPRQSFPKVYVPNGYVDVLKTEFVMQSGLLHGEKMIGFETAEIPDVDTETDWAKLSFYPGLASAADEMLRYLEGRI
jgi:N-acylneuraminate cytidylyltransferase